MPAVLEKINTDLIYYELADQHDARDLTLLRARYLSWAHPTNAPLGRQSFCQTIGQSELDWRCSIYYHLYIFSVDMYHQATYPPRVTVRLPAEKKAQFGALAARRGLSEAGLLRQLIASVLATSAVDPATEALCPDAGETNSFRIWLRPGDGKLLRARARQREMSYSAYVAALIRAHLRADPPMPLNELAQLERSLAEVSAMGRRLAQNAVIAGQGEGADLGMLTELAAVRQALEELRQTLREVVKVSRISWESPDASLTP